MANIITGTSGADALNGLSGDNSISGGAGADKLNGGAGLDTLDGGSGADSLSGNSGDDMLIYRVAENSGGAADIYDGGSGKDVLRLELTLAEWKGATFQADLANYQKFLDLNTNWRTLEANNSIFKFTAFGLEVSKIETLRVFVDGVELTPDDDKMTLGEETLTATEDGAAGATINLLGNDVVPDQVMTFTNSGVAHGVLTVSVDLNAVNNPKALANYKADAAYWNHLSVGQTGYETFTYTVKDANGDSQTQTVKVAIAGVNDGPTAMADTGAATENQALTVDVLANDTDPDDIHSFTLVSATAPGGKGVASVSADNKLTFTPGTDFDHLKAGATETVVVGYTMKDDQGATSNSTLTLTITGVNDGPVAVADAAAGTENATLTVDVLANDTDADDGHVFTLLTATAPNGKGVATVVNNQVVFTPGTDFDHLKAGVTETVVVNYSMKDDQGATSNSTLTLTITGVNDGPVAVADAAAGTENETLTVDVLANDTDVDDGHVLTLVSASAPAGMGSASVVGGKVVFTPGADFDHLAKDAKATVVVNYTMQDEWGAQSSSTLTVTVTGTNDGPVAVADAASTGENASVTVDVVANDTDVDDGAVLSLVSVANGSGKGSVSMSGGKLVFDPGTDFDHLAQGVSEKVVLSYVVKDEYGATSNGTVEITVVGTNDGPVAHADTAAGTENQTLTVDVLANDTDVDDGHVFTLVSATALKGVATVVNNQLVFNPGAAFDHLPANATEKVIVSYDMRDEFGAVSSSTVEITVTGTNDGPVANADTASGGENETLSIDVLANDTDADDGHVFTLLTATAPAGKGVATVVDNKLAFNPGAAFDHLAVGHSEKVVVTYEMRDDQGATSSSSVEITVVGTNDGPVAVNDTGAGTENETLTLDVLANDTDADDGHSFTLLTATAPAGHGVASVVGNKLVFDPGTDFDRLPVGATEDVTLSYQMQDDQGATSTASVKVTVTGTNDAPVLTPVDVSETLTETDAGLSTDGSLTVFDVDTGDVVALTVDAFSRGGTGVTTVGDAALKAMLTVDANGAWHFNSAGEAFNSLGAGKTLVLSYTIKAADGHGGTDSEVVTVTIVGSNDAAVIGSPASADVTEDVAVNGAGDLTASGVLTISDADAGEAMFQTTVLSAPGNLGGLTIDAGGAYVYAVANSAAQFLGVNETHLDSFTVKALDGTTQVVTFTVHGTNDAPVITLVGGDTAAANLAETNAPLSASGHLTVTDADASDHPALSVTAVSVGGTGSTTLTPSVLQAMMSIGADGTWHFNSTPQAFDNLPNGKTLVLGYTIQASDGHGGLDTEVVTVTVTGTNDAAMIGTPPSADVTEDASAPQLTATGVLAISDLDDGEAKFQTVVSGAAGNLGSLTIDAGGAYTYAVANAATQSLGANQTHVDTFTVTSLDGTTKDVSFTIHGVNDAAVIGDPTVTDVTEDVAVSAGVLTAAGTISVTDADAGQAAFQTTVLSAPGNLGGLTIDAGGAYAYTVANSAAQYLGVGEVKVDKFTVTTLDGTAKEVSFTVHGANDAPVISLVGADSAAAGLSETDAGLVANGHVTVTDADANDAPALSVNGVTVGGTGSTLLGNAALKAMMTVDADGSWHFNSGAEAFNSLATGQTLVLSYELKADDGHSGTDTETVTVTVTGTNDAPVVTSGATGAVAENAAVSTVVYDASATDVDSASLTFSLSGADAGLFNIDATTGEVTFKASPDFEAPGDAGGDNVYDIIVAASDGAATTTKAVAVTVTNVNEAPTIVGGDSVGVSVAENTTPVTTIVATDPDAASVLTYSIQGGADASKFVINAATGALSFVTAPNFEAPTDAGANNVYDVVVRATDAGGLFDDQAVAVTVTNANEAPAITSNGGGASATATVAENSTAVTTVTATDPDAASVITYSIQGGADAAKFVINPTTGALSFTAAPNFEAPTDAGGDNVYDVVVRASDAGGLFDDQAIAVSVTNVNEAPAITSNGGGATATVSVAENTTAVTTVVAADPDAAPGIVYSIQGGADSGKFVINPTTGALSFAAAPNFEAPTDAGANNVYDVVVRATDAGGLFDDQAVAVTVTNANEAPAITSNGGGASATATVAENSTAVTTVTATDPDAASVITYSIQGGADSAKFVINPTTGALSFAAAPNFEAPTDAGGDNVYDVVVRASDAGGLFDDQAIAVSVTNVNEAPAITSNGGGATATVSVAENTTAVTTVVAADPDAAPGIVYSIQGGADAAKFAINASTGALTFISAPDFEAPTDSGANNGYDVVVRATDNGGLFDDQAITVNVTNVAENAAPVANADLVYVSTGTSPAFFSAAALLKNDTDPENDALTFVGVSGANVSYDAGTGLVSLTSTGVTSFTYQVKDAANNVSTGTVTVTAVTVSSAADSVTLSGTYAASYIDAAGGGDTVSGGAGVDWFLGNAGADVLIGGSANDTLDAGAGDDNVQGGAGDDSLSGANNNDTLTGGAGNDVMAGGSGGDVFVFTAISDGADTVTDFSHNQDMIDLRGIDAVTSGPGNAGDQAFLYGGQTTSVIANSVTWFQSGGNTIIQVDVNGNTTADYTITLAGNVTLTSSDFFL